MMMSDKQDVVSQRITQLRIELDAASRETERLSHEHEAIALEIEAALDEDPSRLPELDRKLRAAHQKLIAARSAKQTLRAKLDRLYNEAVTGSGDDEVEEPG